VVARAAGNEVALNGMFGDNWLRLGGNWCGWPGVTAPAGRGGAAANLNWRRKRVTARRAAAPLPTPACHHLKA